MSKQTIEIELVDWDEFMAEEKARQEEELKKIHEYQRQNATKEKSLVAYMYEVAGTLD